MWAPRKKVCLPKDRKWRAALDNENVSDYEDQVVGSSDDEVVLSTDCEAQLDKQDDDQNQPASSDRDDAEVPAQDLLPELARWCRRNCREGGAAAAACLSAMREVGSHPRRMLLALGTTAAGQAFLKDCASRYEAALRKSPMRLERARFRGCIG